MAENLEEIAPMLGKLGYKYDFGGEKPSYGKPDQSVLDNLAKAGEFHHEWDKKEEGEEKK